MIVDTIWWTFSFHWPYYTIFLLSFLLLYFYHRLSKFNWDTSKFFSFLFFSSSNFHWYQFNSYIYVNASQIHILLQIFFSSRHLFTFLYSYCISQYPYLLGSNQLPISYCGFLFLWEYFSKFLGLKQGQTSFLFPLPQIQWVIKFLTNSFSINKFRDMASD